LVRGLHLLDPSRLPGSVEDPLRMHLDFLLSLAVGIAMMVVVVAEIRRRARHLDRGLERFAEISSAAAGLTRVDELFQMVLERMMTYQRASAGWIGLVTRDEQEARLK